MDEWEQYLQQPPTRPRPAHDSVTHTETGMTLKEQAMRFIEQVRAGQVGEAMETAADILKSSAGFYKLIFGGSVVTAATMTEEDLSDEVTALTGLRFDLTEPVAAGVPHANNAALWLVLIDVVLKIIAERNKK